MNKENNNWRDKIRNDYKGILSTEIIERSIEYWADLLSQKQKELERAIEGKRMPTSFRENDKNIIGISNSGYNQALSDIQELVKEILK